MGHPNVSKLIEIVSGYTNEFLNFLYNVEQSHLIHR